MSSVFKFASLNRYVCHLSIKKPMGNTEYRLALSNGPGKSRIEHLPILIIVGPSGVGKTTLQRRLRIEFKNVFDFSISYTTRARRPSDREGIDYYFITNELFDQMVQRDEFLEHSNYVGNQYGTALCEINRIQALEKVPLLEIEVDGYNQVRSKGLNTKGVFVSVSDMDDLKARLRKRGSDNEAAVNKRFERARQEMEEARNSVFEHWLLNDDLEKAYQELKSKILEWYPIQEIEESGQTPSVKEKHHVPAVA